MTLGLNAADSGCLLLADISGYTDYLQSTELEHAQDVLADPLETLVDTLRPVFKLSKLEAMPPSPTPRESLNPTMTMDTVEAGYFTFMKRLRAEGHHPLDL